MVTIPAYCKYGSSNRRVHSMEAMAHLQPYRPNRAVAIVHTLSVGCHARNQSTLRGFADLSVPPARVVLAGGCRTIQGACRRSARHALFKCQKTRPPLKPGRCAQHAAEKHWAAHLTSGIYTITRWAKQLNARPRLTAGGTRGPCSCTCDFAEDGRPATQLNHVDQNYRSKLYLDCPHVHYAVLNGRDNHLLAERRIQRSITPVGQPRRRRTRQSNHQSVQILKALKPKGSSYPVRAVRRKTLASSYLRSRTTATCCLALGPTNQLQAPTKTGTVRSNASAPGTLRHWRAIRLF